MTPGARARMHACGAQTAWTAVSPPDRAVAELAAALDRTRVGQLVVFFSPSYEPEALAAAFTALFPGVPFAGCSTSGEITPAGLSDGGLVLVAFPNEGFRIVSEAIPDVHGLTVERGAAVVRRLRAALDRLDSGRPGCHRFALSFIDGLSNCEEMVVAAIAWALDETPLVGGSAGDDLAFARTVLLHNGEVHREAAVLLLVETDFPAQIFKNDNFEPTETKLVVTASDTENRIVREFNAEPAAAEYATSVGIDAGSLTPMSFASHPVVVRVGGEYFCRSIQRMNPDGSLSFFCAIDDGIVLTVAQPRDMVAAVESELSRLDDSLGGVDLVLGFDCVLRRLDAEARQVRHRISDLYRRFNVVGFHTYGEQYRSMHLNQTFTGVAIGRGPHR